MNSFLVLGVALQVAPWSTRSVVYVNSPISEFREDAWKSTWRRQTIHWARNGVPGGVRFGSVRMVGNPVATFLRIASTDSVRLRRHPGGTTQIALYWPTREDLRTCSPRCLSDCPARRRLRRCVRRPRSTSAWSNPAIR